MGLDIYVGSLTRYYNRNWKTATEQWAEENGIGYERIEPESEEDLLPPEQVQDIMCHWRDSVLSVIASSAGQMEPWTEDNEAPYWTEKPDWPAYGALLLYAAAKVYGESYPTTVPKNWDYTQEALIQRAQADTQMSWSLFKGAEWWLPVEVPLLLKGETPVGSMIPISTAGALMLELLRINELGWKADEETVLSWMKTEGYPVDATVEQGNMGTVTEHTQYSTVSLARYAYSILWQAAKFSLQNKVPILLDY